jgi:uncharacterized protein
MFTQTHHLISPAPGTARAITSFHYEPQGSPFAQSATATRKVYIQASLHADELPGMLVAHYLRDQLSQLEAAGKVNAQIVLVPIANPIGLSQAVLQAQLGRFEMFSGENFNRHYPSFADAIESAVAKRLTTDELANTRIIREEMRSAMTKLSPRRELDSQRLALMRLAFDADLVLDLHCDSEAALHLYTGTPLWPIVEPLARLMQSQATLLATESGDHPFDEACSQTWWLLRERFSKSHPQCPIGHGCTAVTVELRGERDVQHDLAKRDAQSIIDYLVYRGDLQGDVVTLPPLAQPATPLAGVDTLVAPVGGILTFIQQVGAIVKAGTVMAQIIDAVTGEVSDVRCTVDGVFFAHVRNRLAFAGMSIGKVSGSTAFKTGKLLSA